MGRSPFFTIHQICRPSVDQSLTNLQMLTELVSLKVGQKVKFSVKQVYEFGISRSISVYDYTPSAISSHIEYVVTSTNYAPGLSEIELKAFALKDPSISDKKHIVGWIITSDGYIRETEHYTILYKLDSLKIIE